MFRRRSTTPGYGQKWLGSRTNQGAGISNIRLLMDFRETFNRRWCAHPKIWRNIISIQTLSARDERAASSWLAIIAIPILLTAPALWNGYPLLQWDTGGYLARWYEGYLFPSRSTTFGLYLHF